MGYLSLPLIYHLIPLKADQKSNKILWYTAISESALEKLATDMLEISK